MDGWMKDMTGQGSITDLPQTGFKSSKNLITITQEYNDVSQILQIMKKEILKERLWKKDCERKTLKKRL